jgi:hypothetical protein
VRVGRDALDAEAKQLLEEHNPDVVFDWARLLKSGSTGFPATAASDLMPSRDERRRDRRDRRGRPGDANAAVQTPAAEFRQAADLTEGADLSGRPDLAEAADISDSPDFRQAADLAESADPAGRTDSREAADVTDPAHFTQAADATPVVPGPPPADETVEPRYRRLGADGLARLRARYVDLRARIAGRAVDDAQRPEQEELLAKVERLNPDAWQTEEEVTHALEEYEVVFEALRSFVGRQPRPRRL